jgi:hypothetical protein
MNIHAKLLQLLCVQPSTRRKCNIRLQAVPLLLFEL